MTRGYGGTRSSNDMSRCTISEGVDDDDDDDVRELECRTFLLDGNRSRIGDRGTILDDRSSHEDDDDDEENREFDDGRFGLFWLTVSVSMDFFFLEVTAAAAFVSFVFDDEEWCDDLFWRTGGGANGDDGLEPEPSSAFFMPDDDGAAVFRANFNGDGVPTTSTISLSESEESPVSDMYSLDLNSFCDT